MATPLQEALKNNIWAWNHDACDAASETAIQLLAEAGLRPDQLDRGGDDVSDTLQALLTLVFLRSPEVHVLIERLLLP